MDYMEDNAIPAGDPVTHGPTATLIGSDGPSTRNVQNVLNAGEHDVVAHGSRSGFLEMPHGDVNAGQLVDAVRNNPHYNAGPLRGRFSFPSVERGYVVWALVYQLDLKQEL
ncbi:hypothetical protein [Streptomyces sp. NPDC006459]|uniref:hypothetical protein n=1 Tax=Streptomyces sp. NPDC006459 TaxID=3154303 RepID=UPI0033BCA70E